MDMNRSGFTLLEIMVAVTILVMLVLMMSTAFHQSTVVWDSGLRKSEGNMNARAALALMSQELAYVMPDDVFDMTGNDPLPQNFIKGGDSGAGEINFYTLCSDSYPNQPKGERRMVKFIKYYLDGDQLIRAEQRMSDEYDDLDNTIQKQCIVTNVTRLMFYAPGGVTYYHSTVPPWIRVEMSLKRTEDVSTVGARSAGPDCVLGNDDDIASW